MVRIVINYHLSVGRIHIILAFFHDAGDVLVVLDLRADDSLVEAGFAREVKI